jgi:hypothetical protein
MRPRYSLGLLVVVGSSLGAAAFGQDWWWPPDFAVDPQNPTADDTIALTLFGEWPDSCPPNVFAVQPPAEGRLMYDATLDYPGGACLTVITTWKHSESVPPLAPGCYDVYVQLFRDGALFRPPVLLGSIVVRPAIRRGDMNCDGVLNFRDINPFVLRLTDPSAYEAAQPACNGDSADMNADGVVDFRDINPFVELMLQPLG